jgi:capsule biosynthesis phosphatase
MYLIIPLGSIGENFRRSGYSLPKPLIRVLGRPMIFWVLASMDLQDFQTIFIPYHPDLSRFRFEDLLRKEFPSAPFKFVQVSSTSKSVLETMLMVLDNIDPVPILCVDGDCFYHSPDIIKKWVRSDTKNAVFCFNDGEGPTADEPRFSHYSHLSVNDGYLINFVEKSRISELACSGAYGFSNACVLKDYCCKVLDELTKKNDIQPYLSSVVRNIIDDGNQFIPIEIDSSDWTCLGSPLQLILFATTSQKLLVESTFKPIRVCFDLDNTLVTFPRIAGDYTSVEPIEHMIQFLRKLKMLGHTIIINTARRMATHKGNVGKIIADIGKLTLDSLDKFNIPYDEIYFGKPQANWYIDDLAISSFSDMFTELGFYDMNIDPRSFHSIQTSNVRTITKRGDDLSGEIYYYTHIPDSVKNLFPFLFRYDKIHSKFFEIEFIPGVPATKLFVSQSMTGTQFEKIIKSLFRLHETNMDGTYDQISKLHIYSNYYQKVKGRLEKYAHIYESIDPDGSIGNGILDFLQTYENEKRAKPGIIHGDPVFTNILFDKVGDVKFIDMRGKLGSTTTIYGDTIYDYAKVIQSLYGYDEILEGYSVEENYRMKMIDLCMKFLKLKFDEDVLRDIKCICASLFYSLIPLHDSIRHKAFCDMALKMMVDSKLVMKQDKIDMKVTI